MDIVVGIDSSTTATKAIAWDAKGRAVAEGRATVPMVSPHPGWFEQGVEDWWASLCAALAMLFKEVDPARVAAVAIANQRETVGFLDENDREIRPAILWLDLRSRPDIDYLSEKLGSGRFLAITGKTPDTTPAAFSLHWMGRCEPENWRRTATTVDPHGYLVWRLTGERVTSWGSADPHGVMALVSKRYSPEIMAALGAVESQFFPPVRPGTHLGGVTPAAAAATGLRAGTKIIAGGGDGQSSGLGTATLGGGRAYLNLGTAAVSGVWSWHFAADPAFRTLTSLSGEGYIYELCLLTGSFLTDWMVSRLFGFDPKADPGVYERLEAEATALPIGSGGLLLLPYWQGVMSPFWNPDARGAVVGLGAGHGRAHVYRAMMEGVALDLAMGYDAIEKVTGVPVTELLGIGGGSRSRLWRQIVADATGRPVRVSATVEATCLGAGMLAAAGAGWYATPADAAREMQGGITDSVEPDPRRHDDYAELLQIYKDIHPALESTFKRLADFRSSRM
ncbi:MAG: FGGY family carbohydrate kinase [Geminicoccaceae bacterium]